MSHGNLLCHTDLTDLTDKRYAKVQSTKIK